MDETPAMRRTRYQLRAMGGKMPEENPHVSGVHTRGYLPHVKVEGASYFVTFRLDDALPQEVLRRFKAEEAERLRALAGEVAEGGLRANAEAEIRRAYRRRIERHLDRGAGACHLRHPEVAAMIAGALRFFHEERYLLGEWVIMPNHVHAVVWPKPNHRLGQILKSWKQFTSRRAKEILGLPEGRLWQPESFDRWIRDDPAAARIAAYIRNNPVSAGLCASPEDWLWSSAASGPATK